MLLVLLNGVLGWSSILLQLIFTFLCLRDQLRSMCDQQIWVPVIRECYLNGPGNSKPHAIPPNRSKSLGISFGKRHHITSSSITIATPVFDAQQCQRQRRTKRRRNERSASSIIGNTRETPERTKIKSLKKPADSSYRSLERRQPTKCLTGGAAALRRVLLAPTTTTRVLIPRHPSTVPPRMLLEHRLYAGSVTLKLPERRCNPTTFVSSWTSWRIRTK